MKKLAILIAITLTVCACGPQKTSDRITVLPENPSWQTYLKYCGSQNENAELNFKVFQGQEISWYGKITDHVKDKGRKDSAKLSTFDFHIKMKPSQATLADIVLRIPKGREVEFIKKYKIGSYIRFQGIVKFHGKGLSHHMIDVSNMKKYVKKTGKKE